ncbi:MAG TPA: hypothetical protein DCM86_09380 [Verrucomicrobiales bacterium]|nr:hypothetical protein [Verrucomicrobiales bacterium]
MNRALHPLSRLAASSLLVAGLFLLPAAGPSAARAAAADPLSALFGDPVLVRGKNVEVKRSQLDDAFIAYRANLAARGEDVRDDQRLDRENSLLERIILTQIISTVATEEDRKAAGDLAKKFVDDAKKSVGNDDLAFERQLKSLGLTVKQFTDRVQEQSLVETVLDRELKSAVNVTEADMRKFYADNPERFRQPELAEGQHIIIFTRDPRTGADLAPDQVKPKRERMQRAASRARAGEDFEILLKEYSEDPDLAQKKGQFIISKINRYPEIEGAAFSLPINAISEIITTPNAMHILKVTKRTPAMQIEFEKVQEDLKKYLGHRELEKKLPDYFARLKAEAKLEVTDPKYKPALEKVSGDAFEGGLGVKPQPKQ